jgi:hypothetical protein
MRTPVGHATMPSHTRGAVQLSAASITLRVLLIALVVSSRATAFAPSNPNDQQRVWLPASPNGAFAGEVSSVFDSVLNKTTATYVAPLRSEGLLRRILFPTPTVHTIKATYEFRGRIASHVPDSVHLTFVSDEYNAAPPRNEFFCGSAQEMTIRFGQAAPQNLLRVSQRIQLDSSSPATINRVEFSSGRQPSIQIPAIELAHVTRTATASLSICEFLALVDRRAIDGTVGGLEFTLNREVVAGLKLFAAKMLPDVTQERSIDCTSK